jgi:sugar lactone lactonase YvrE
MRLLALIAALLLAPAVPASADRLTAVDAFDVYADGFSDLYGVATGGRGVFVADRRAGIVARIGFDGRTTVVAANLDHPVGVALDGAGRLLIAEEGAGRVVRLEPSGARTVVASGLAQPRWLAAAADGSIYVSARALGRDDDRASGGDADDLRVVVRVAPDRSLSVFASGFARLEGLALDDHALFVAARGDDDTDTDGTILEIPIRTDGAAGPAAPLVAGRQLGKPVGLARDSLGALYVTAADLRLPDGASARAVAKLHQGGRLTAFAAELREPRGLAFDADGNLYVADGDAGRVLRFHAPPRPSVTAPLFTRQSPLTVTGQAAAGARLDAFVDATAVRTLADSTGRFSATIELQPDRLNTVETFATSRGGLGLTSAATDTLVTHDGVAPTVVFEAPPAGAFVRGRVGIRAQASDAGSRLAAVTIVVAGAAAPAALVPPPPAVTIAAGAVWDTTGVRDGAQTVSASAIDRAGNIATANRILIVDNAAPVAAITSAPPPTGAASTVVFRFTATDNLTPEPALQFSWRVDDGPFTAFAAATTALFSDLASGAHAFELKARDLAGNESAVVRQPFTVNAVRLSIDQPTAGATVPAGLLLVRGAVEGAGPDVAVSVNGVVAAVQAGTFVAQVPVDGATTALTAMAVGPDGVAARSTLPLTVAVAATTPPTLVATPSAGVAPLTVRFTLGGPLPSRVAIDADGDGIVDFTGATLAGQRFTFTQPGVYVPAVTITDDQGRRFTATAVVLVESPAAITTRLQALWNDFTARLAANDVRGAMARVSPTLQPQLTRVFQALGTSLPAVASTLEPLVVVERVDDLAEAAIRRDERGTPFLYFIYFRRNSLGQWLIEEM